MSDCDSDEKPTTSLEKKEQEIKAKKVDEKLVAKECEETGTSFDFLQNSIRTLFDKLTLTTHGSRDSESAEQILEDVSYAGLMRYWKETGFKKIIVMSGAGMSTSAGIPDFRSPGSGLYHNLQRYNLPYPMAIFELEYFKMHPKAFYSLAKELYPGAVKPTPAHYFVRLLHEKGLLVRQYTQNIDTLERIAGIPEEKLVEAHGTFYKNHCTECRRDYSMPWVKEQIFQDLVPTCIYCGGLVKPDIVFFGENLPERFYELPEKDFAKCDLLIIMGTSLEVQPFSRLVDRVSPKCVRLLINRTKVGGSNLDWMDVPYFAFDSPKNKRDVFYEGDCDDAVWDMVGILKWKNTLRALIDKGDDKCITIPLMPKGVIKEDHETGDKASSSPGARDSDRREVKDNPSSESS